MTDDYFTPTEKEGNGKHTLLFKYKPSYELINIEEIGSNAKEGNSNIGRTYIFVHDKLNISALLKENIQNAPQFYLSTLLSATLHNNTECIDDLMSGNLVFANFGCFHALGPTDNIWTSPCFFDLSLAIVESFFRTESNAKYINSLYLCSSGSGVQFLNKFWLYEFYDFIIFSNDKGQKKPIKNESLNTLS